jgi:hypothetical protein
MLAVLLLATSLFAQKPVPVAAKSSFPVELLVQSPAATKTELQVICLFHADSETKLEGSLQEIDEKLGGLLTRIRKTNLFSGNLGDTLVVKPKPNTIPARRLLLVGLGDIGAFSADREQQVGFIVFEESKRLGVRHPFFAPTVLDGGKTGISTGAVAEQFMRGFLRAKESEEAVAAAGMSTPGKPVSLTFLAGAAHAADTKAGLARGEKLD